MTTKRKAGTESAAANAKSAGAKDPVEPPPPPETKLDDIPDLSDKPSPGEVESQQAAGADDGLPDYSAVMTGGESEAICDDGLPDFSDAPNPQPPQPPESAKPSDSIEGETDKVSEALDFSKAIDRAGWIRMLTERLAKVDVEIYIEVESPSRMTSLVNEREALKSLIANNVREQQQDRDAILADIDLANSLWQADQRTAVRDAEGQARARQMEAEARGDLEIRAKQEREILATKREQLKGSGGWSKGQVDNHNAQIEQMEIRLSNLEARLQEQPLRIPGNPPALSTSERLRAIEITAAQAGTDSETARLWLLEPDFYCRHSGQRELLDRVLTQLQGERDKLEHLG